MAAKNVHRVHHMSHTRRMKVGSTRNQLARHAHQQWLQQQQQQQLRHYWALQKLSHPQCVTTHKSPYPDRVLVHVEWQGELLDARYALAVSGGSQGHNQPVILQGCTACKLHVASSDTCRQSVAADGLTAAGVAAGCRLDAQYLVL